MKKRITVAATVGFSVVVSLALALGVGQSAAQADTVTYHLLGAVKHLSVGAQSHQASYDRDRYFGDWIEQGQGCDTRAVVLQEESKTPVTQNDNCTVESGTWKSYYDGQTYRDASALQVDHLVPVANVWISGGWRWTQATRVAYYNDLDDPRTLVAVDAHDNESKSDQTPDEWLPPKHECRYIREYVSVKLRWQLIVTRAEKQAIRGIARGCRNTTLAYVPADVR